MSIVRNPNYNYSEKILGVSKMDLLVNRMNVLQEMKANSQKGYPYIEFSPEGYITYIKSEFVNQIGYSKKDFEGLHFSDFVNTKDTSRAIAPEVWNKVLNGEIVVIDFTVNTINNEKINIKSFFEGVKNSRGIVFKIFLKATQW